MIKICSIAFLSLLLSASSLFAQTKTFAGADYSQGIVFVMENNQMVWKHKAPDSNDLWILPNGNILFTTGHGVLEMTRQNDTIFHYESKSPVFACQRLKNGNTFVGEMCYRTDAGDISQREDCERNLHPAERREGWRIRIHA